MNCPDCNGELKGRVKHFTCEACGKKWLAEYTCRICGAETEKNQSCGAPTFYCRPCQSLRSRENLNIDLSPDSGE
ncbi:MAG: zinc-ribbon domain-containing protein [Spirochaetales bacterium]|nr:zinc-ribbon domain-containing protein [Spirochaetales bacterium]